MKLRLGRKLVILIFLIICGSLAVAYRQAEKNYRIFSTVWLLVKVNYYDKNYNGLDWTKVKERFLLQVLWAKEAARDASILQMLSLMESSHLTYVPAWRLVTTAASTAPKLEVLLPETRRMAGLTIAGPRIGKTPLVLALDENSSLYRAGVRAGMHISVSLSKNPSSDGTRLSYHFILADGNEQDIEGQTPHQTSRTPAPKKISEEVSDAISVDSADTAILGLIYGSTDQSLQNSKPIYIVQDHLVLSSGRPATLPIIADVEKGSAADLAGLEPGAMVTGMEAKPTKAGFSLQITSLSPSNKLSTLALEGVLDNRLPEAIRSKKEVGDTLILRFDSFDAESIAWVEECLRTSTFRDLVIDLRFNSGGAESSVTRFLANFLPPNERVGSKISSNKTVDLRVDTGVRRYKTPIAVLVGPLTASAAEVTASALKYVGKSRIVGSLTAGEVLISQTYTLYDGSLLQIPIFGFVDAAGHTLEGRGVEPDKYILNSLEDIRHGNDSLIEYVVNKAGTI